MIFFCTTSCTNHAKTENAIILSYENTEIIKQSMGIADRHDTFYIYRIRYIADSIVSNYRTINKFVAGDKISILIYE